MPTNSEIISRDPKERLAGRLIALPTSTVIREKNLEETDAIRRAVSIDFPAMPDSVELARSTDYAISTNIALPDGVHQYRGTNPLKIPFSFRIHSNDSQYCPQGALTLIKIASRLHSYVLPLSDDQTALVTAATAAPKSGTGSEGQINHDASTNENVFRVLGSGKLFPPVTCWLHLMFIEDKQPGISCVGYVSEVAAKFNGPWLRGNNGEFNLPTSCDYSFTFVHLPNHGNGLGFQSSALKPVVKPQTQAYAATVKDRLYNTRHLVTVANFRGFE